MRDHVAVIVATGVGAASFGVARSIARLRPEARDGPLPALVAPHRLPAAAPDAADQDGRGGHAPQQNHNIQCRLPPGPVVGTQTERSTTEKYSHRRPGRKGQSSPGDRFPTHRAG